MRAGFTTSHFGGFPPNRHYSTFKGLDHMLKALRFSTSRRSESQKTDRLDLFRSSTETTNIPVRASTDFPQSWKTKIIIKT